MKHTWLIVCTVYVLLATLQWFTGRYFLSLGTRPSHTEVNPILVNWLLDSLSSCALILRKGNPVTKLMATKRS